MENLTTRDIKLSNGNVLQLSVSPEFYSVVRKYFNLGDFETVTDEHLRYFIFNATNNALNKAEKEIPSEQFETHIK